MLLRRFLSSFTRDLSFEKESKLIHLEKRFRTERSRHMIDARQYESLGFDREIRMVIEQYEQMRRDTSRVPSHVSIEQMTQLLQLTPAEQKKRLTHLYEKEFWKWKNKMEMHKQSEETAKRLLKRYEEMNTDERIGIYNSESNIIYGLWHNTLFTRIKLRHLSYYKTKRFTAFDSKLIIDFQHFNDLQSNFARKCVFKEISLLMRDNRNHVTPFQLYFHRFYESPETFPFVAINELFDSEHVIYITPDGECPLDESDHSFDNIYMINAVTNEQFLPPLTVQIPEDSSIRTRCLPKQMTLNNVMRVLRTFHNTKQLDIEFDS